LDFAETSSIAKIHPSIEVMMLLKRVTVPGGNVEGDCLNDEESASNHGVNALKLPNNSEQLLIWTNTITKVFKIFFEMLPQIMNVLTKQKKRSKDKRKQREITIVMPQNQSSRVDIARSIE
jgi:hypothetical protein